MDKISHPDQRYLVALANNDRALIDEIYKKCAGKVKSFVTFNNGNSNDAQDIFQEVLIDLYEQTKYRDLKLTCPFEPFFLMVCKRKWLNQLKKRGRIPVTNMEEDLLILSEDTFAQADLLETQQAQADLFIKAFAKLGESCKQIITLSMQGDSQEKSAEVLGISYGYLRKKKSECMASLIKIVNHKP